MMATANSKILLKKNKEQRHIVRCSICGKKLKLAGTSENPLSCWQCLIVNADS
ncbi:MAG: hypothetical protein M3299_10190 [Thermoproteota archaeon]|nr:hypothetical protein [Thermoproteota archaeon]